MTEMLVPIQEKLVELTFQIHKFFRQIGLNFLDDPEKEPAELIISLIEHNFKSPQTTRSQTPT